jgi:hypothetical protein
LHAGRTGRGGGAGSGGDRREGGQGSHGGLPSASTGPAGPGIAIQHLARPSRPRPAVRTGRSPCRVVPSLPRGSPCRPPGKSCPAQVAHQRRPIAAGPWRNLVAGPGTALGCRELRRRPIARAASSRTEDPCR